MLLINKNLFFLSFLIVVFAISGTEDSPRTWFQRISQIPVYAWKGTYDVPLKTGALLVKKNNNATEKDQNQNSTSSFLTVRKKNEKSTTDVNEKIIKNFHTIEWNPLKPNPWYLKWPTLGLYPDNFKEITTNSETIRLKETEYTIEGQRIFALEKDTTFTSEAMITTDRAVMVLGVYTLLSVSTYVIAMLTSKK